MIMMIEVRVFSLKLEGLVRLSIQWRSGIAG